MSSQDRPFIILTGIDFSEESDHALSVAHDMAKRMPSAELHVVHVLPPPVGAVGITGASPNLAAEFTESLSRARKELEDLCKRLAPEVGERMVGHVRAGSPAREVTTLAREISADLVIMGTHGRTGVARLLLGSVAEAVTRKAPCSVLTTKTRPPTAEEMIEPPRDETPEVAKLHESQHPKAHTYSSHPDAFRHESFRFNH